MRHELVPSRMGGLNHLKPDRKTGTRKPRARGAMRTSPAIPGLFQPQGAVGPVDEQRNFPRVQAPLGSFPQFDQGLAFVAPGTQADVLVDLLNWKPILRLPRVMVPEEVQQGPLIGG
jgi:hypothetical protein